VGADGERSGVAILLGGGDDAAFPAQMIAAECGDVAGDDAAAQWCTCCRRSEQVRVGVKCPHLQDALVCTGAVARHDGDVLAEAVGRGVDAAGVQIDAVDRLGLQGNCESVCVGAHDVSVRVGDRCAGWHWLCADRRGGAVNPEEPGGSAGCGFSAASRRAAPRRVVRTENAAGAARAQQSRARARRRGERASPRGEG